MRYARNCDEPYPNVRLYGRFYERATIEEGAIIGEGTGIGQNTYIGKNAKIGRNCRILYHVTICKDAVIGDNVFIGPNTTFLNDKYPPTHVSLPPTVEDDAIIGGGVILAPNVKIGKRAVVGAGSVITRDVLTETVIITESKQKTIMTRAEYDMKQSELLERFK